MYLGFALGQMELVLMIARFAQLLVVTPTEERTPDPIGPRADAVKRAISANVLAICVGRIALGAALQHGGPRPEWDSARRFRVHWTGTYIGGGLSSGHGKGAPQRGVGHRRHRRGQERLPWSPRGLQSGEGEQLQVS